MYDSVVKKAKESHEYEPPNEYNKDGCNLYLRLENDKDAVLLFLHDRDVPATNNAAEGCAHLSQLLRWSFPYTDHEAEQHKCLGE